jgi:toxin-antitoxin system PIN domain toxin
MIVPDVNVLIYAYDTLSPFHLKCKAWWASEIDSGASIGIPWSVTIGFLRLITHPGLFAQPYSVDEAVSIVQEWFRQPNVVPLDPGPRHMTLLGELLRQVQVGGKLVNDANLAALAKEYRAQFVTNDRDFERFSGISLWNPV